jgi:hypothetical protein
MEEPIKVHSVGFGFLCIKQGIFEKMSRPWFGSPQVAYTEPKTNKEYSFPLMGEDMSWCHRVGEMGIDIWLDPKVRVTHHKMMKLTWNGIQP